MKLQKSSLIVSIAAAVLLLGIAFAVGMKFGYVFGLLCGLGTFLLLAAALVILNKSEKK